MAETFIQSPPRTIMEVWESLPEGTLCQLINNALVMSPAPLDTHQKILGKIFAKLFTKIEERNLGELRVAPYDVHLDAENIFQPDIVFVGKENINKIKERGLYGAPDLVIEILSPGNKKFDKRDKKDIYEKHGVKEYWIIDPADKQVTGYTLVNDEFVQTSNDTATINSALVNLTITF
jgi:Uma2 family endonuclease